MKFHRKHSTNMNDLTSYRFPATNYPSNSSVIWYISKLLANNWRPSHSCRSTGSIMREKPFTVRITATFLHCPNNVSCSPFCLLLSVRIVNSVSSYCMSFFQVMEPLDMPDCRWGSYSIYGHNLLYALPKDYTGKWWIKPNPARTLVVIKIT